MDVKDIMTKNLITASEDDTAEKCARLLNKYNIGGLPVVNKEGKLTGMITENDLIRRATDLQGPAYLEILGGIIYLDSPKDFIEELKKAMSQMVKDVMTKDVVTIDQDENVDHAAAVLVSKGIKRLPVLDDEG